MRGIESQNGGRVARATCDFARTTRRASPRRRTVVRRGSRSTGSLTALADGVIGFVVEQLLGPRRIGMDVICVGVIALGGPDFEGGCELIANLRGERFAIDGVRRADIDRLPVGSVGLKECAIRLDDVVDIGEIVGLGAVTVDGGWFVVVTTKKQTLAHFVHENTSRRNL